MILELEISGARIIIAGDNLSISVTDGGEPQKVSLSTTSMSPQDRTEEGSCRANAGGDYVTERDCQPVTDQIDTATPADAVSGVTAGETASNSLPIKTRSPTSAGDEGHRSTPSRSHGGAKSGGVFTASVERAGVEPGIRSAQDRQALTNPFQKLRPHCQRPSECAGYGAKHCHTCLRAVEASEVA